MLTPMSEVVDRSAIDECLFKKSLLWRWWRWIIGGIICRSFYL